MDINEAMKLFLESSIEDARKLRKINKAQLIVPLLDQLNAEGEKVKERIQCEVAVIQAQHLINYQCPAAPKP